MKPTSKLTLLAVLTASLLSACSSGGGKAPAPMPAPEVIPPKAEEPKKPAPEVIPPKAEEPKQPAPKPEPKPNPDQEVFNRLRLNLV